MANPLTTAAIKTMFQQAAPFTGTAPMATPSGVFDETLLPQAGIIYPLKSFSAVLATGSVQSFLYGTPAVIDALDLVNLQTQNGGVKATGTITIGGTPANLDTFTVVLGGVSKTFTCGAGDTTPTQTGIDLAAFINANLGFVVATQATGVITLTAQKSGTRANYTLSVSKVSVSGTITPSGGALTGGTTGKLFN